MGGSTSAGWVSRCSQPSRLRFPSSYSTDGGMPLPLALHKARPSVALLSPLPLPLPPARRAVAAHPDPNLSSHIGAAKNRGVQIRVFTALQARTAPQCSHSLPAGAPGPALPPLPRHPGSPHRN